MPSAVIIDCPAAIAQWLVSFGAIRDGPTVMDERKEEIRQLKPKEWADVQNGKVSAAAAPARARVRLFSPPAA